MSTPTEPHYDAHGVAVHHGDCLDVLRTIPTASVDAVVTDPPYGLEFMGKDWDAPWQERGIGGNTAGIAPVRMADGHERLARPSYFGSPNPTCLNCGGCQRGREGRAVRKCVCDDPQFPNVTAPRMRAFQEWCEQWAAECLRVLRPGGHLLAFGGTRTWHRLTCAIEDAGFEIRDTITWLYGSGFPKSLDVGKAIDKAAGAQREVVGQRVDHDITRNGYASRLGNITRDVHAGPATDDAARWDGWGTALKPASEPIVVARKPLAGTVAANVLTHGTGALNIDGCRVEGGERPGREQVRNGVAQSTFGQVAGKSGMATGSTTVGRWPSNVVLTHAPDCEHEDDGGCVEGCPIAELDAQSGTLASGANPTRRGSDTLRDTYGDFTGQEACTPARGADSGGASRFFPTFRYEAKADAGERPRAGTTAHPTVKPLDLMRWLVRLVTPPGGLVLDPFAGSGTTAEACLIEGFRCIAIEREGDYLPLIVHRITKRIDPVAHLAAQADRGEDVDLGLFGLLDDLGGVA